MSWVLYYDDMRTKIWLLNVLGDGVLWVAVICTASGAGLLLEAIVDTVRYGHVR